MAGLQQRFLRLVLCKFPSCSEFETHLSSDRKVRLSGIEEVILAVWLWVMITDLVLSQ